MTSKSAILELGLGFEFRNGKSLALFFCGRKIPWGTRIGRENLLLEELIVILQ
jgi:hypothetical protein